MTLENTASGEESLLNYEPGFVSHFLYWSPCFFFVFLFCSNEFDFGLSEPEERSGWMHYSVPAMFTILKGSAVSTEAWLRHMRESRKPWSASSFTRHWRNTSTKTSTPLQVVKKRKEHRISLLWWWQLHFQKGVRPASPTLMVNTWVLCISRNLTSWNFFFFFCETLGDSCILLFVFTEVIRTRLREEGSKYKYFFQTGRLIAVEEGYAAFYRGLVPQLIRQIPNTAIVLSTYELIVHLLGDSKWIQIL